MVRRAVLLRAVNVGGRPLPMASLRTVLMQAGCGSVETVGGSGNAVVDTPSSLSGDRLERRVESLLLRSVGLKTDVFVRDGDDWKSVVKGNPFLPEAKNDPAHLVVTFLKARPEPAAWTALASAVVGRERTARGERHAYLVYPDGIGRSKLTLARIERSLGVRGTSRNWNTVLRLADLLHA